jgi:hypothetical protein
MTYNVAMFVQPDERFDVWFAVFNPGEQYKKVMVIAPRVARINDEWDMAEDSRILFAGGVVPELKRLLNLYGRVKLNRLTTCDAYPNGIFTSGYQYDAVRRYVGHTDYRYIRKEPE